MWFNAFTEYGMASKKYREIYWGKYKEDFSTLLNDSGIMVEIFIWHYLKP